MRGVTVDCYFHDQDQGLGLHARTDFFGGFRIGPMPAGTYRFRAKTDDLPAVWTDDVTVAHGATLPIGEIRLSRPGFLAVEFRSRSGRTAEGLGLIIRDASGHYSFRRALSSDPSFRWPLVPGRHTVTVQGKGLLEQEVDHRLR